MLDGINCGHNNSAGITEPRSGSNKDFSSTACVSCQVLVLSRPARCRKPTNDIYQVIIVQIRREFSDGI